jgi:Fe-S cluster assembly protein SufB
MPDQELWVQRERDRQKPRDVGGKMDSHSVESLSALKREPAWMLRRRLQALHHFEGQGLVYGGVSAAGLELPSIQLFIPGLGRKFTRWQDVPRDLRRAYDKILPGSRSRSLGSGVQAQRDSEVFFGTLRSQLQKQGVIFTDSDSALRDYPDLVRRYSGCVVSPSDELLAALNAAFWSGGAFVYVPEGISVELPLQAHFHIAAENFGQFERSLIVVERGAKLNYVESCTSEAGRVRSIHAGVVEILVGPDAVCRFTSIQTWSPQVNNFSTKAVHVAQGGSMEWIEGNFGARATRSYPTTHLLGKQSKVKTVSLSIAFQNQHQDSGARIWHVAPATSSEIVAKSIAGHGGRTTFRGLVNILPGSKRSKSRITCDSLLLDPESCCETYPELSLAEGDG